MPDEIDFGPISQEELDRWTAEERRKTDERRGQRMYQRTEQACLTALEKFHQSLPSISTSPRTVLDVWVTIRSRSVRFVVQTRRGGPSDTRGAEKAP